MADCSTRVPLVQGVSKPHDSLRKSRGNCCIPSTAHGIASHQALRQLPSPSIVHANMLRDQRVSCQVTLSYDHRESRVTGSIVQALHQPFDRSTGLFPAFREAHCRLSHTRVTRQHHSTMQTMQNRQMRAFNAKAHRGISRHTAVRCVASVAATDTVEKAGEAAPGAQRPRRRRATGAVTQHTSARARRSGRAAVHGADGPGKPGLYWSFQHQPMISGQLVGSRAARRSRGGVGWCRLARA